MSTPKPGQIRCPTCHSSTPPASFCTQCGQPIPSSALARPRGLDRDELEERLRRRPVDGPYRRGTSAAEGVAAAGAFAQPFEPEPEDELALHGPADAAEAESRVDNLGPQSEALPAGSLPARPLPADPAARRWPREAPKLPGAAPYRFEPGPEPPWPVEPQQHAASPPRPVGPERSSGTPAPAAPVAVQPEPEDEHVGDNAYAYDYDYDDAQPYYRDEPASSGTSPLLIVGIIGLGLVALFGGVLLAGMLGRSPGVGQASPTPTATVVEQTASPTTRASAGPTSSAAASGGPPGTFPDGFTASVQPCATKQMNRDGCKESGATVTGGTVWVWAGFTKGTGDDVVGVTLVDKTGGALQDASLELSKINCGQACNGWLTFSFSGLTAGHYKLRVSRNGAPAAEAPFTVS